MCSESIVQKKPIILFLRIIASEATFVDADGVHNHSRGSNWCEAASHWVLRAFISVVEEEIKSFSLVKVEKNVTPIKC